MGNLKMMYEDFSKDKNPNTIWTWMYDGDDGYKFDEVELNAAVAGE